MAGVAAPLPIWRLGQSAVVLRRVLPPPADRAGAMMHGKGKIWFDFLNADQRIAVSERMMLPVEPMVKIGDHWGYGLNVICGGDERHAAAIARKMRSDFLDTIGHKLPIWCCPRFDLATIWQPAKRPRHDSGA